MRRAFGALFATGVAAVAAATLAAPAAACPTCGGGGSPGGYEVVASVVFSGDAAPPGGGGGVSVSIPAKCWWTVFSSQGVSGSDTAATLAWLQQTYGGGHYSGIQWVALFGPLADYEQAAAREAAGDDLAWYQLQCREGMNDLTDPEVVAMGNGTVAPFGDGQAYPVVMQLLAEGSPPPPPLVDPDDLADIAHDQMVLVEPAVDRNPKVPGAGDATLVRLPTWFWVTDPAAVGGVDATRTIRAEVGPVWAEVVATTDGLTISSPAGGTTCTAAQARVQWGGVGDPCTLTFSRASVDYPGGYPVTASAEWGATYTTSAGGPPQGLPVRVATAAPVGVPVLESQALVRRS